MKKYGIFDIIGPIMIGPSSSHTAGAARLGKVARTIAGGNIKKVEFILHGSFAKTYRGHGTDRALVAGIMGMNPWDDRLKNSLDIAMEVGIDIFFKEDDLGDVHPNTVKFVIYKEGGDVTEVVGSSIGGGSIVITEVDGEKIEFTGEYPTLIIKHKDIPGVVAKVTSALYDENVNIAFMKVFRSSKGSEATMIFEMDNKTSEKSLDIIREIDEITDVKFISPVKDGDQ